MPFFFFDWTMIIVVPGFLLALYAQFRLKALYS